MAPQSLEIVRNCDLGDNKMKWNPIKTDDPTDRKTGFLHLSCDFSVDFVARPFFPNFGISRILPNSLVCWISAPKSVETVRNYGLENNQMTSNPIKTGDPTDWKTGCLHLSCDFGIDFVARPFFPNFGISRICQIPWFARFWPRNRWK